MGAAAPARKAPSPAPRRNAKARALAKRRQAAKARARAKPRGGNGAASRRKPTMTVYRARPGALAPAGAIPVAVGRTAVAVRDLPDSSLVVRLTRGRAWIGVLGTLLAGIVGLNVVSLGLNASSGRTSQEITSLERENSSLRASIAEKLSSDRVEAAAAELGLVVPHPDDIAYLASSEGDVQRAAEALARGIDASSGPAAPTTSAATPPTVPSTSAPVAPTPAPAPVAPAPSAPAPTGGGTAGGGISPG